MSHVASSGVIERPNTSFDGASHTYGIEGWADEDVVGVSSAAKVGQALDAFDIGSRWGFRLGYEGAYDVVAEFGETLPATKDQLRSVMQEQGLTPWSKRDKAAERGTWVHDVFEALAQENQIPKLDQFPEEVRGHVKSVLGWYVEYRPSFVATEVQVASTTHGFAGRYDIRATIPARKLVHLFEGHESESARRIEALKAFGGHGDALCLIDLKTSKDIFPETHFPQLALYELASVEMGFPVTDCQLVLNSKPDGSPAVMGASWVEPRDALVFVEAYRTIHRIKAADPQEKLKKMRQKDLLLELRDGPAWSSQLVERVPSLSDLDAKAVGRMCGSLKKRGLVEQDERKRWHLV